VLAELEVAGGEIPDQTLRILRTVRAENPDDLDSPLIYTVDMPDTVDADVTTTSKASGMPPARVKLLAALDAHENPASIPQLVDWIVAHHGHGLKRPTCSTQLSALREAGLADYRDVGVEHLWFRAGPKGAT
jgi:hypothetical protein